jgi:pyrroloquinoline-quinone synthase
MAARENFAQFVHEYLTTRPTGGWEIFARAVVSGEATRADLAVFAVQTYHRNLYSSRFASANHARCPHADIRRGLLEVALEEEMAGPGAPPSHAELMLQFAEALGMDRQAVIDARPLPSTLVFIDTIMQLSQGHWLEGMAFRASELRAPKRTSTLYDALQRNYGIAPEALGWWTTHAVADVDHGNIALMAYERATDESEQALALAAIDRMLAAWWVFFNGIMQGGSDARAGRDVGFPLPAGVA